MIETRPQKSRERALLIGLEKARRLQVGLARFPR